MSNPIDDYFEMRKQANPLAMGGAPGMFAGTMAELTKLRSTQAAHDIFENAGGFNRGFRSAFTGSAGGKNLATAALTIGGGLLMAGAIPAAGKILQAVTKRRDYRQMMSYNPDLANYKEDNPRLFRQAYDSLRNANPHYAADPLIAGAHMRKIMDNPEVAGLTLAEAMGERPGEISSTMQFKQTDQMPTGMSIQTKHRR